MAIPDYESIMLPLLKFAGDMREHSLREVIDALAGKFSLSDEERRATLPSGQQAIFDNRVGWARTYLKKAGLLSTPRRAYFEITAAGKAALKTNPPKIENEFLDQYPEFMAFRTMKKGPGQAKGTVSAQKETETPEETLVSAYETLREGLEDDLLQQVKSISVDRYPLREMSRSVIDIKNRKWCTSIKVGSSLNDRNTFRA